MLKLRVSHTRDPDGWFGELSSSGLHDPRTGQLQPPRKGTRRPTSAASASFGRKPRSSTTFSTRLALSVYVKVKALGLRPEGCQANSSTISSKLGLKPRCVITFR